MPLLDHFGGAAYVVWRDTKAERYYEQLFTEVEVNSDGYLPSHETAR